VIRNASRSAEQHEFENFGSATGIGPEIGLATEA
jgi:hypothetical protein